MTSMSDALESILQSFNGLFPATFRLLPVSEVHPFSILAFQHNLYPHAMFLSASRYCRVLSIAVDTCTILWCFAVYPRMSLLISYYIFQMGNIHYLPRM